jgi:multiple sugar transport system permease protein
MKKSLIASLIKYAIAVVIMAAMLFPIYLAISTSFMTQQEAHKLPPSFFPNRPTIENYPTVFKTIPYARYFLNSVIVAVIVTVACLFTSSLAGFAFAKYDFYAKRVIFIILLMTMMIPFQVLLIPLYMMMYKMQLINTYWALILPGLSSAFGIFMMRQFIRTIPDDLIDAAKIDGFRDIAIYFRIILPLSKASLGALAIFIFMWNWDSFMWPLIVINTAILRTLPLGLILFSSFYAGPNIPVVLAATTISFVPVLIVFAVLQKQMIQGIALTGLKA